VLLFKILLSALSQTRGLVKLSMDWAVEQIEWIARTARIVKVLFIQLRLIQILNSNYFEYKCYYNIEIINPLYMDYTTHW